MAAKPPRWVYWLAAAVWMIVTLPTGYAIGHGTASTSAAFEQPAPTAIAERAFPGMRVNYVGSGTFKVPSQVAPGTYIVTASGLTFGCSWVTLTADNDKPKSVGDSGTVNRGAFGQFTVAPTDRVLKLIGDCTTARQ